MAKFSPMEAVFSGLLFARARPATLLIWSAFLLVVMTVASLALFDLGGDSMIQLIAATRSSTPNVKQMVGLMQGLGGPFAFYALLLLVFGSVLVTAVLRVCLTPPPHPWGGLRLGGDELRVLGAVAALAVSFLAAEILLGVAAGMAAGLSSALAVVVLFAGYLLVLGMMVRLSLAPVVAMSEKTVSLARAFALTKGQFWRLLGAYVLLTAIMLVILVLVLILFSALMAAVAAATGGGLNQLLFAVRHNFQDLNPILLLIYVLTNLAQVWVSVAFLTVCMSVAVQAYKAATGSQPRP